MKKEDWIDALVLLLGIIVFGILILVFAGIGY
jgi:hypothetical protein